MILNPVWLQVPVAGSGGTERRAAQTIVCRSRNYTNRLLGERIVQSVLHRSRVDAEFVDGCGRSLGRTKLRFLRDSEI
jgi:hypothetical protein